jgi:hypothetical protein
MVMATFQIKQVCTYTAFIEADSLAEALEIADDMGDDDFSSANWGDTEVTEVEGDA